jgi:hypothetical protein
MWYHPAYPHRFYHAEAHSDVEKVVSRHSVIQARILKFKYSGWRSWWNVDIINLSNNKTISTQFRPDDFLDIFQKVRIQTKHYNNHNFDIVLKILTDFINKRVVRLELKFDPETEMYRPLSIQGNVNSFDNAIRSACGFPSLEQQEDMAERREEYQKIVAQLAYMNNE